MQSFDDFLNQQLTEAGVLDLARGYKDKKLANWGNNAAKGRNNLREMEKQLARDFKVYCAEQQLRFPADVTLEDFLEFLKYKVGFNFPEDHFNRIAYGASASGEPQDAERIRELYKEIARDLEAQQPLGQAFDEMAQIARQPDADGVAARKALWGLSRENPSQLSSFKRHKALVGKPVGQAALPKLISSIASVILKHSKVGIDSEKEGKGAKKRAGYPEERVDPAELEVGQVEWLNPMHLQARGWNHDVLRTQLEEYGFDIKEVQKWAVKAKDFDMSDAKKAAAKLNLKFNRKQTVNLTRILLQCFRGNAGKLSEFFEAFKGNPAFVSGIKAALSMGAAVDGSDVDGNKTRYYDGSEMNNLIAKEITEEDAAARMLVVLIHNLRLVMPV